MTTPTTPASVPELTDSPRDGLPETPWGPAAGFAILALCVIGAAVLAIPFGLVLGEDLLFATPVYEILVALALWWIVGVRYGHDGYDALLQPRGTAATRARMALLLGAAAAAALYAIEVATASLLETFHGPLPPVQEEVTAVLLAGGVTGALAIVTVVLFAPVVEELLFRGLLYQGLLRRWRPWLAAAASSIVFAALHVEPTLAGTAVVLPFIFLMGLLSCWLLTRTGTLLSSVSLHAVANAASVIDLHVWRV